VFPQSNHFQASTEEFFAVISTARWWAIPAVLFWVMGIYKI